MLIIADDLSGAADCGVACVTAGLATIVALERQDEVVEADVLSLDADTRRLRSDEAAAKIRNVVGQSAQNPGLLLFKKIDSTLRGNVGAELAAALEALGKARPQHQSVAIMAPAFPAFGRTTRNGTQYVHGQPLHDLDIWRIQGMADHAHIPDILRTAGLQSAVIGIEMIRSLPDALVSEMNAASCGNHVLVCDAEKESDLRAIASASMRLKSMPLWVGSAGLAYQLPAASGIAMETVSRAVEAPQLSGPVLFVIGSLSRNSLEQVRVLSSLPGTASVCAAPELLLEGERHHEWASRVLELVNAIRSGKDVVLTPGNETCIDLSQRPLLAHALARMAASVRDEAGALVASGGETARAVFEAFGIGHLRLRGELEKGIPVSTTEGWNRSLPVITKAGDFGGVDALIKCSRYLHAEDPRLTSACETGKVQE